MSTNATIRATGAASLLAYDRLAEALIAVIVSPAVIAGLLALRSLPIV